MKAFRSSGKMLVGDYILNLEAITNHFYIDKTILNEVWCNIHSYKI